MSDKDLFARQLILDFPSQPEYLFSNFVVSDGSKTAFNAAHQLCSRTDSSFNSLYLFGGKNLGKTHLLISIGNKSVAMGKKALYVHGVRSRQPRAYRSAKGIGMDTGDAKHDRYLNEYCAVYPIYIFTNLIENNLFFF